ncbi:uncharacterized protein SCHCODRAFT_02080484 [Schizophyllum commune H4-8]|uniref:uncharacterized protein n=1 Tax=Schizophyllum commune (strain H4-8 / FGSC 9210) TaxID=578458 RepID=UPI00215FBA72|nr:uncharacterized protein SCHCODRAFT_02080484 [Schizophyllum commune H4-8]KAI5886760.1 hypothetical protein SCHCODRAFT_02080484 [Schizophyllum commune H4-8]
MRSSPDRLADAHVVASIDRQSRSPLARSIGRRARRLDQRTRSSLARQTAALHRSADALVASIDRQARSTGQSLLVRRIVPINIRIPYYAHRGSCFDTPLPRCPCPAGLYLVTHQLRYSRVFPLIIGFLDSRAHFLRLMDRSCARH